MSKDGSNQYNPENFFSLSFHPMCVLEEGFMIKKINPAFARLTGMDKFSVCGKNISDFLHDDDSDKMMEELKRVKRNESGNLLFEARFINILSEVIWISWQIVLDTEQNLYYLTGMDVTEYRITRSVLEEHMDKLLQIIELVPHPIFLKDSGANYILVNQAQANLFSASRKDFIGRDDSYFIKDSEELKGVHASDQIVLKDQKSVILPEQIITHPSGETRILHTSKIPFLSSFNGDVNILGVSIDITDLKTKENELRKINFELDSFVYHASHDLRAPLCSLEGLLNLIGTDKDESIRMKCVSEGISSIKRLDGFIADLTDLSRNSRIELETDNIKFKKIIDRTFSNLKYIQNADRIKVNISVEKETPFYSDKHRLKIIFMNLISNSIKYQKVVEMNPEISISVKSGKNDAIIRISDNGIGIEEKYQQHVFDMFFRGTEKSSGSGLGLYIVKETVSKMGGSLGMESRPGKGTTLTIILPNMNPE